MFVVCGSAVKIFVRNCTHLVHHLLLQFHIATADVYTPTDQRIDRDTRRTKHRIRTQTKKKEPIENNKITRHSKLQAMPHSCRRVSSVLFQVLLLSAACLSPMPVAHAKVADESPSEAWDEVTTALDVFNTDVVYKGTDRKCDACTFLGTQILNGWTKYAYKLKKWSQKKKRKKATKAVDQMCSRISKQQICLTGDKGFQDFNQLMKTGIISNINMDGKFATHLFSLCQVLQPKLLEFDLQERMSSVVKLYDYNLQLDLCQHVLHACGSKRKGKDSKGKKKKKQKQKQERSQKDFHAYKESGNAKREESGEGTIDVDDDDMDTIEL